MAEKNANMVVDGHYYILLEDKTGEKRDKGISVITRKNSEKKFVSLLKGEILLEAYKKNQPKEEMLNIRLKPVEWPSVTLECSMKDVERIDYVEASLLLPLCSLSERLKLFQERDKLKFGKKLTVGCNVWASISVKGIQREFPGVVRYKGPLPITQGTMFGVELEDCTGKGTSDGSFKSKHYFRCAKDSAIFVSLNKLSPSNSTISIKNKKLNLDDNGGCLVEVNDNKNTETLSRQSLLSNSMDENIDHKVGDQVWAYIKDKPRRGNIRYIGRPPGAKQILAGIDMDMDCGKGDGDYYGKRFFSCPTNHAHFTPIGQVVSKEMFAQMYHQPEDYKNPDLKEKVPSCEDIVQMESKFAKLSQEDVIQEQEDILRKLHAQKECEIVNGKLTSSENKDAVLNNDHSSKDTQTLLASAQDTQPGRTSSGSRGYGQENKPHSNVSTRLRNETSEHLNSYPSVSSETLDIGSMVEVLSKASDPKYGVIRWIGFTPNSQKKVAGLELDEEMDACTDGIFLGKRYFTCPRNRGFFVHLHNCQPDSRFGRGRNSLTSVDKRLSGVDFGSYDSPIIEDRFVPPPETLETYTMTGGPGGVQGHHNSCYLDATLFASFAFSSIIDTILLREKQNNDIELYDPVQKVLRDFIVYPLRANGFVRADRVLELRQLLDRLGTVTGLVGEEKDPEEFLLTLFQHALKSEPFLKIKSGRDVNEEFFYQVFTDKDVERVLPSVEELLKRSFHQSNLRLAEVPSCLIIQMPRFGKGFKMYKRILPSLTINIGELVDNVPQDCAVCGRLAKYHCNDCFTLTGFTENDSSGNFCKDCNERIHSHLRRSKHESRPLAVSKEICKHFAQIPVEHLEMELFAVVCIETSHYVTFVRCENHNREERWCFFDSMADRVGSKNGYNIPAVTECPEVVGWLSSEKQNRERIINSDDKEMPDKVKRILCDAYMCFYQSKEMSMYR